ncbi:MAG: hemerythrin domain-containing protein [candidate division Zixibacteria bacterium]|nr:hemerythrin domain-containing protein [candidate division Zixibacteria bacterium]
MEPTRILSAEHRVIETVIACLERIVEETRKNGKLDKIAAEQAIDFIRNFADGCHHAKEEDRLFPAMEAKGMPRQGGPIGVMLIEHEYGRAFVRGMVEHLEKSTTGDSQAITEFSRHALGYAELLKQHIHKEDHILFPMADRFMSPDDEQVLMAQFNEAEAHIGEGTHERLLGIAESLAKRYGVSTEHIDHMKHHSGRH